MSLVLDPAHTCRATLPPPLLTVLVPVFNEERTVEAVLGRLQEGPYPDKEVIVVDDGSTDATPRILANWAERPGFLLLRHDRNRGKGSAIRTGLARARGEITIIQDADLEYDPADFPRLVEVIRRGESEVVYGSRYLNPSPSLPLTRFRLAVGFFNLLVRVLYGQRLTDEATCYKAFRTSLLRRLDLQATGFEFCPEVTAKVCRQGHRIAEVPIAYRPRSLADGKKIGWADGWLAVWTLLKYRFWCKPTGPVEPPHSPPGVVEHLPQAFGEALCRCAGEVRPHPSQAQGVP
jgi:dolichol-phosphate mannosyltransferase